MKVIIMIIVIYRLIHKRYPSLLAISLTYKKRLSNQMQLLLLKI